MTRTTSAVALLGAAMLSTGVAAAFSLHDDACAAPSIPDSVSPAQARLASLCLLDDLVFEPDRETWAEMAATNDASTDVGLTARGALALAAGERGAARELFEAARDANDGLFCPPYFLARLALDSGDARGALEQLGVAIRCRRDFAAAYDLLAAVHFQLGNEELAFSALRTVIALAPGLEEPHFELGRAYLEHGRPRHAVVELSRASELDRDHLETLYLLGRAKVNAGLIQEGFADLERYVATADGRPGEEERVSRARLLLQRFATGPG